MYIFIYGLIYVNEPLRYISYNINKSHQLINRGGDKL